MYNVIHAHCMAGFNMVLRHLMVPYAAQPTEGRVISECHTCCIFSGMYWWVGQYNLHIP